MKRLKNLIFCLAFVLLFNINSVAAWDGTTTSEPSITNGVYQISNAEELAWFSENVNSGSSIDAKLIADIDLENQNWSAIGTTSNPFTGTFDVDNNKITNFSTSSAGAWVSGLFGKSQGTIKNLSLSGSITAAGNGAGTIVGWNDGGTVVNVYSDVNLSYASSARTNGAGIAGQNSNSGKILNSMYAGTINGYTDTGGARQAGGIVGTNQNAFIIGCINKGEIIGAKGSLASAVGGIVSTASLSGVSQNYIYNNINLGKVSAESTNGKVAGIVSTGSAISSNSGSKFIIINNLNLTSLDTPIINTQPNSDYATNHIVNNYYLADTTDYAIGAVNEEDAKTEELVNKLNSNDGSEYEITIDSSVLFKQVNNDFPTLTWNQTEDTSQEDQEYVDNALQAIESSWFKLAPVYGEDTNVNDIIEQKLTELNYPDLKVTIAESADTAYVDLDGKITYFYADPNSTQAMWFKSVKVKFNLTKNNSSASASYQTNAVIHWDRELLEKVTKEEISDLITADIIKNENTDLTSVTTNLSLTKSVNNKKWALATWTSSDSDIIEIDNSQEQNTATFYNPFIGKVKRSFDDKEVTLTVTVKNNLTQSGQPDITVSKDFKVIVKGIGSELEGIMQNDLDTNYTVEKLTDMVSKNTIDSNNVVNDIQLLTPAKTGVPNYNNYKFSVTTEDENLKVNGYRLVVYRPLASQEAKEAKFTVTMTHKDYNISVSKEVTIKLKPLTNEEIDNEVNFMNQVKEHYFDGINNNVNTDKNNITNNLTSFIQAQNDNGNIKWIYAAKDTTEAGINTVSIDLSRPSEQWDRFHSSEPSVIEHETLRVTQPAEDKEVTITSCLSSNVYAKYAEKYPDNEQFKKLARQMVSEKVTVLGTNTPIEPVEPQDATVSVTIEGYDKTLLSETQVTVSPTDISNIIGGDSNTWTNTEDGKPLTIHAIVKALEEKGYDPSDKNILNSNNGTYIEKVLGLSAYATGPNSAWMFALNNQIPGYGINQQTLSDNDKIVLYFTTDYTNQSYSYFDRTIVMTNENDEITLQNKQIVVDQTTWESSVQPVVNGKLIIEKLNNKGEVIETLPNEFISNSEGTFTFKLTEASTYNISSFSGTGEYSTTTRASVKIIVKSQKLNSLLEEAKSIDTTKYTADSVKNLNDCLEKVQTIYDKANYTKEEIDTAITELEAALNALKTLSSNSECTKSGITCDSRDRVIKKVTKYANGKTKQVITIKYQGTTKNRSYYQENNYSTAGIITLTKKYSSYYKNKYRNNEVIKRNNKKKITYLQKITRYNNFKTKTTRTYTYYSNGKNKAFVGNNYNSKGYRTLMITKNHYSNGKLKIYKKYSKFYKKTYRLRNITTYTVKGKKKTYEVLKRNSKAKITSRVKYYYNKNGKLASTRKYGKAYKLTYKYSKGKVVKRTKRTY